MGERPYTDPLRHVDSPEKRSGPGLCPLMIMAFFTVVMTLVITIIAS